MVTTTRRTSRAIRLVAAAVIAAIAGAVPAAAHWSGAFAGARSAAASVRCAVTTAPPAPTSPPAPAAAPPAQAAAPATDGAQVTGTGGIQVSVVVPSTVFVRVNPDGLITAVATNTYRPPAVTDLFAVATSDTSSVPASDCVRQTVLAAVGDASGVWPPGEWHTLDARPLTA